MFWVAFILTCIAGPLVGAKLGTSLRDQGSLVGDKAGPGDTAAGVVSWWFLIGAASFGISASGEDVRVLLGDGATVLSTFFVAAAIGFTGIVVFYAIKAAWDWLNQAIKAVWDWVNQIF